jgi:DNA mismatch repair protein MutS
MHEGAKTLVDVIDKTISPMGARLLRRWIVLPLKEEKAIKERLNGVEYFFQHPDEQDELATSIRQVGDLERIISKLAMNRISPREVVQLKNALIAIPNIKQICEQSEEPTLLHISDQLNPCNSIRERITKELNEEAPAMVQKGNVIAPGVSAELDELRNIMTSGKDYLNYVQQRESERTGIPSLKVHFNNVFGYYIEVRNTHKDKVPSDWIRKQTLVSAERYITEELKEYESKILGAEEKILQLETNLFNDLIIGISEFINAIQLNAVLVARLDCLQSFATIARLNKYNKPEINNTEILNIKDGRHPVIETQLSADSPYIANDVYLDNSDQQIIIITGPNMSGKSALLRQTALIVLLAQMGSFVPAASAEIGLVDKIFTRVGASDNISVGESTFMVEMLETASILNNVSSRSLILLDEIGRGTSTYDGISIAWAMVEYLHEHPSAKAKTLFATHYHELNEMEKSFGRIKNFNVSIKELDKKILFLRKLVPGGSEHSFGIHVARRAGMPRSVVQRAEDILKEMEASQRTEAPARPSSDIGNKREGYQLSFFQLDDPVLKQIRDEIKHININSLTPLEALNKLSEIKKLAGL